MMITKKIQLLFFVGFIMFIPLSFPSVTKAAENIDTAVGWEVDFHSSILNLEGNQVFIQGVDGEEQRYILNNFANIGDAQLTATKSIFMKKGYTYNLDLIYAMLFSNGTAYIDFNGDEHVVNDDDASDKHFNKIITASEDMTYIITIHYDVKKRSNGYLKLGYSHDSPGIIGLKDDTQVIVHYINEEGEKILEDSTMSGREGESYNTDQKVISGYTFEKVIGETTGIFTEEPKEISYIYKKNVENNAHITVHYIDEEGKKISEDVKISGEVGEPYTAEQKEIPNYIFEKVIGETTGVFTEEPKEISYVYKKNIENNQEVLVHYIDEDGKKLAEDITLVGIVGTHYETELKEVDGYKLKKIDGESFGIYRDKLQEVTYIYEKIHSINKENGDDSGTDYSGSIQKFASNKRLPSTGEQRSRVLFVIGVFSSVISISYIFLKKYNYKINE